MKKGKESFPMVSENLAAQRRQKTISRVYHCLYDAKAPCTKACLSQTLGLSLPTVYQALNSLMDMGLVQYCGEEQSTGGRRAQNLSIVSDARVAVGISITEDRIRLVLADLYLQELHYASIHHSLSWDSEEFPKFLYDTLETFLNDHQVDRGKLLGVGIALPGVITPDKQRILLAPTLGLQNTDLNALTCRIPYPVYLDNDATCGGRAEWFLRGGQSNLAYFSLESGVGGAVFFGGSPYNGDNLRSGEFGHMCVEPAGLPCKCGKRGCLEAYSSVLRIKNTLGVTLEEFAQGLSAHNPDYELLLHDMLRHLAIGIDNIRMALDCDVILGGLLTEYLAPYMQQLQEYARAYNIFGDSADYIHLSSLRQHSVSLGAALHFIQNFISEY